MDNNMLNDMLGKVQEMQKNMENAQKEITNLEVTGEAGAEPLIVKITINGRHEAKRAYIAQPLMREEKEILEDMIVSAFNNAVTKAEKEAQEKMTKLLGNMQLPEGFPMPFGGDDKKGG